MMSASYRAHRALRAFLYSILLSTAAVLMTGGVLVCLLQDAVAGKANTHWCIFAIIIFVAALMTLYVDVKRAWRRYKAGIITARFL